MSPSRNLAVPVTARIAALVVALAGCAAPAPPAVVAGAGSDGRAPDAFRVRLETTKGLIVLEVQRAWAPHGADRFHRLVREGYFDDAAIFRVRAGAFAQFGIAGDPAIAQRWRTRTIPDDPRVLSNTRGAVAFAFKDPNGRTTQVFINLRDNSEKHDAEPFVPFARVVEGIEVADALYSEYGERAASSYSRSASANWPAFPGTSWPGTPSTASGS